MPNPELPPYVPPRDPRIPEPVPVSMPPHITSFDVSADTAIDDSLIAFTAVFENGTAIISNVGSCFSMTPIQTQVHLEDGPAYREYILTVTGLTGQQVTQSLFVGISPKMPLGDHAHLIEHITNLPAELATKATNVALTEGLATKAPLVHTHPMGIANVDGLQGALDAKATPADVTAAIEAVVALAPNTLNTLDELAAALGDDPNFAASLTVTLASKAPLVHSHVADDIAVPATLVLRTAPQTISPGGTVNWYETIPANRLYGVSVVPVVPPGLNDNITVKFYGNESGPLAFNTLMYSATFTYTLPTDTSQAWYYRDGQLGKRMRFSITNNGASELTGVQVDVTAEPF